MAGATIGYAAVTQSTIRTTGGGITTYVGHYVNATVGYYVGENEVIDTQMKGLIIGEGKEFASKKDWIDCRTDAYILEDDGGKN